MIHALGFACFRSGGGKSRQRGLANLLGSRRRVKFVGCCKFALQIPKVGVRLSSRVAEPTSDENYAGAATRKGEQPSPFRVPEMIAGRIVSISVSLFP